MQYEAHITVRGEDIGRWKETCSALGIRPLVIRLSEGEHPLQMMCAAKRDGTFETARAWVRGLEDGVRKAGYTIIQTKLESALIDAPPEPTVYYECHFKIDMDGAPDEDLLRDLKTLGIHASENVLAAVDGMRRWYMTMRRREGTPAEARAAFGEALRSVRRHLAVRAVHLERVVLETWPGIDEGWIVPMNA